MKKIKWLISSLIYSLCVAIVLALPLLLLGDILIRLGSLITKLSTWYMNSWSSPSWALTLFGIVVFGVYVQFIKPLKF